MDLRFPCSNPRRLPCLDYTALIIDIRQYRRLLSTCIVRAQAQCLISRLGVISPQAREAARRREVAGRMERQLKEERRVNWMANLLGPGSAREQDAIQCLNLYFPRTSSAFLCFLFAQNFYKLSQHSLINVMRRIIDICRTSLYANQQSLLTPVIAEVTEGNDIMEEQFEIEEDLPARSGDRWMKR